MPSDLAAVDAAEATLDALIDEWHTGDGKVDGVVVGLPEFLGMSKSDYALWVMCKLPAAKLIDWHQKHLAAKK
ncbi:hypothetical protein AB0E01_22840 [Nocardia vinacea]|uniref:hypothetical protein n=1 Tax=Nocardia vinacea TaxID=96468 RepID=UPI0033C660A0